MLYPVALIISASPNNPITFGIKFSKFNINGASKALPLVTLINKESHSSSKNNDSKKLARNKKIPTAYLGKLEPGFVVLESNI